MPSADLSRLLEDVNDSTTFRRFAKALEADRRVAAEAERNNRGQDADSWENTTIEDYLEAVLAWAERTDIGVGQGIPEENVWKRVAAFLYCGKIYE